jgi:hypothetical protein
MEFKRIYLPYNVNNKPQEKINKIQLTWSACDDKSTHKVDKQIEQLLADGFKIVSTCAITECLNLFIRNGEPAYASYTKGIEVFMVKD